ncbi:transcriptional regulator [Sphingobium sp. CFD-2]|jgi:transcriptional regulator with XRE-family HTH domain|uniref:helix-turn-helix domain-containing protein n=1 Tax=Sphingobium sp. CFD-2 TaxID=2878542 RepID=UPI00214BB861|nr:transcriptional regulator [Sphingobium sp. CFD-2]TNE30019.1 MAG: transcriptional regulator [Alphaproteobacteria bacterium]TNF05267.1 MAG: transcriptional regulator [Sphingomonadales bacterium]
MSSNERFAAVDLSPLKLIKKIAGERIRQERKRRHITQPELAQEMGFSPRWLREMESGAPSTRLDDHLNATLRLGQSVGHIVLPLLCMGHGIRFPQHLIYDDLGDIELKCIELIAGSAVNSLKQDLSPEWWPSGEA